MKRKSLLIIILILIICFTALILFLFNSKKDKFNVSFESRKDKIGTKLGNENIIGWIEVQGTNIDYPIMKNKSVSGISSAEDLEHLWLSNQYIEGSNRKAIYGHNILNVSSEPLIANPKHSRFEQLLSFTDYDFAKNNLYIQYTHDDKEEIYMIYAVSFQYNAIEMGYSYNDEDAENYIEKAKNDSIFDYDIDVNSDDEIIALITCTRYYGNTSRNQFRVDARKIRENENITKYKVEKNKNYDIIKEDRES